MILQIITKLQVVHGDLSEPGCGISTADQNQLKSDVQYVVHSAASIRFDNPVHTDLNLSYMATKALADMATRVSGPLYVVMRHSIFLYCKRTCQQTRQVGCCTIVPAYQCMKAFIHNALW